MTTRHADRFITHHRHDLLRKADPIAAAFDGFRIMSPEDAFAFVRRVKFRRDRRRSVRHADTTWPRLSDDIGERGIDLLCATWHMLDRMTRGLRAREQRQTVPAHDSAPVL